MSCPTETVWEDLVDGELSAGEHGIQSIGAGGRAAVQDDGVVRGLDDPQILTIAGDIDIDRRGCILRRGDTWQYTECQRGGEGRESGSADWQGLTRHEMSHDTE